MQSEPEQSGIDKISQNDIIDPGIIIGGRKETKCTIYLLVITSA